MERMDTGDVPSPQPLNKSPTEDNDVIEGHRACETKNGKWLCIGQIYEKLHRPNVYDIGGTYMDRVPDFWFTCKIERIHGICLLHVFAGNHVEGIHSVGLGSDIVFNDKDPTVRITGDIETFEFNCKVAHNQSYITTYSFKNADVEDFMKDKKLYIAVRLAEREKRQDNRLNEGTDMVKLLHDNVALLMEPLGSDFIIESELGEEFPVHRSVLSLQSEVFKAMLKEDMAESKTGRVKLVDVDTEDLKIMIEFMYTNTIKQIDDINIPKVIMLADRFNLLGLRKLCDYILIDQLAPDTALDILVLADRFDYTNVKNMALQYIRRNKEHFKNDKFDQIDNLALMRVLCSGFVS
ncbi:Roadkill [Operophtera brumata]|uniref:Roadkill n=1 Tax=Operophtera brumata TaxID=104452 RepID=A0A0L7L3E0_OPEBR|nr:Roadkill [Operophtera brumata]